MQYLVDADVVSTLRRLRSMLAPPNGRLVIKENRPCDHTVGTETDFQVDVPAGPHGRYDVCRPDGHHAWLFRCASLDVEHSERHGEITAWVLRASAAVDAATTAEEEASTTTLLQPTLDAVAMAAAAAAAEGGELSRLHI